MVKKAHLNTFLDIIMIIHVIRSLCIKLPQILDMLNPLIVIRQRHDNDNRPINDNNNRLLKKYFKIWEKVSILRNIEFDSEPVYGDNDKYIKAKIKSYGDKVNTNFQGKKIPKENASHKCLSLVMLDSVTRVSKKCYPQTLLEECKYETKKTKRENPINDDLHIKVKVHLSKSTFIKVHLNGKVHNPQKRDFSI